MLSKLSEFHVRHVHESVHFELGSVEILDAEGVDCYYFHSALVAYFEYLTHTTSAVLISFLSISMRENSPWLKLQNRDDVLQ